MFSVSADPLDPAALKAGLTASKAGACVTFEGWVRDHNDGRAVTSLEYEVYAPLAEKEGERIIREALTSFGVLHAMCVHRAGALEIGECSVWVGVSAAHRDAAFAAGRYIIDEIKQRLPIWKKEYYADGDSGWVNCEHCAAQGRDRDSVAQLAPRRRSGHEPA